MGINHDEVKAVIRSAFDSFGRFPTDEELDRIRAEPFVEWARYAERESEHGLLDHRGGFDLILALSASERKLVWLNRKVLLGAIRETVVRAQFFAWVLERCPHHSHGEDGRDPCKLAPAGEVCCNPDCRGTKGTGCWCCHHGSYARGARETTMEAALAQDKPKPPLPVRCGDVVRHKPSGEDWVVAYADHQRGELSASGWPFSMVPIEDCDRIEVASDEEHEKHVREWVETGGSHSGSGRDWRYVMVLRLYPEAVKKAKEAKSNG